ncbi:hypothetical protein BM1_04738 [Bipolaris maydis]|nr:hypothetical protein BM1_04738 [Bipolaris maydis]
MSENHSAIGIPNLLNTSSERFAMQGDSDDSAQSHEHLHFYDSTDLHLGLDSGELLNPSDFSFLFTTLECIGADGRLLPPLIIRPTSTYRK